MRIFRHPLLYIIVFSIALGSAWGYRLYRDRENRRTIGASPKTIRVLAIQRLFPATLLEKFEREASIHVELTELPTPEALWEKLESAGTAPDEENGFDLVTLFSYQVPLSMQMARSQPIDPGRLKNLSAIATDFRDLPGDNGLRSVVPVLWGLTGILYDTRHLKRPPNGWHEAIEDSNLEGHIGFPASTFELARLVKLPADAKDLKKTLSAWREAVTFSDDFLSPASLLKDKSKEIWAAMISHGEAAMPTWPDAKAWKFAWPEEKASLWVLSVAPGPKAKASDEAYAFLDYLLRPEAALDMINGFHQASTNREIESIDLDGRLKPSYLRQIPLTKVSFWNDFSRSRELREWIDGETHSAARPVTGGH